MLFYSVTGPDGAFTLENFARFFDFDKPVYIDVYKRQVHWPRDFDSLKENTISTMIGA